MTISKLLNFDHGHTVTRWLLNLAAHPEGARWLMANPHRFAALFAALRHRVQWPTEVLAAIPVDKSAAKVKVRQSQFDTWKKNENLPFDGRLSAAYLEAFWEGTMVAAWAQRESSAWDGSLKKILRAFHKQKPTDSYTRTLSTFASKLGESSGLMAAEVDVPARDVFTLFQMNQLIFKTVVHLNTWQEEILELSFLLVEDEGVRLMFELVGENPRSYADLMSMSLNIDPQNWDDLVASEGLLARCHVVQFEPESRRVLPMHSFWHNWFGGLPKTAGDMVNKLLVPMKRDDNSGALGRLSPDDTQIVHALMQQAGDGESGRNILLYGAKSIDKMGWVYDQAQAVGKKVYTLPASLSDAVRTSVCFVAQRLLARIDPSAILVLPQADTILTRTQRGRHNFLFLSLELDDEMPDSPAEAALLTDNPVTSLWVVHSPERISENNIGRFLYTCEIKAASRSERRTEIATILAPLGLGEDFLNELSQHTRLGEQQLESAVRLVEELGQHTGNLNIAGGLTPGSEAFKQKLVRQAVEQSQKALNRRQKEHLRQPITTYSLDLLNTSGGFSIPQILKSLQRSPNASLCFYGLPGTGKTQLAEHIAVVLDKPILIKRASDVLDKYVGESEKHMKAMFEEARDEDAILLLDEADTFLRDRSMAKNSWEVSMVNELLQGMERHHGVFVCTTNLFQHLDAASLRRFTFKLEFLALEEEQRWQMFLNETALNKESFAAEQLDKWKQDLLFIQNLTPGDFATVQRQVHLLGESLAPDRWLRALAAEAKAKLVGQRAMEAMASSNRTHH